eukprot:gene31366-40752_t
MQSLNENPESSTQYVFESSPRKATYSEREDEEEDNDDFDDDEDRDEVEDYAEEDGDDEDDSANHSASVQSFHINHQPPYASLLSSPSGTSTSSLAAIVRSSALPTVFQQQTGAPEFFVRKVRRREPNYSVVTYNVRQTYDYIVSQTPMDVLQSMGTTLTHFIDSLYDEHIDAIFMQNFFRRYYHSKDFQTPEEKRLYFKLEVVMKAAVVYYLLQKNSTSSHAIKLYEPEEMVAAYPQLQLPHGDPNEIIFLTNFCNAMRIAVRLITPKSKKQLLISICARLEGSGRTYLAGGVQSRHTKHRMRIFEQESGVRPMKRSKRRSPGETPIQQSEDGQKATP